MPSNFPSSYKWHSLYFKTCDRMINICVNVNVSIYHKSPLHTKGFPSIMLCRSIFIFHTYKKITRFCHYLHTCEKSKCVFSIYSYIFSLFSVVSLWWDNMNSFYTCCLPNIYYHYDNNCFSKIDIIIYSIIVGSINCLNVKET